MTRMQQETLDSQSLVVATPCVWRSAFVPATPPQQYGNCSFCLYIGKAPL